jgi:hypothetical protein
VKREKTVAVLVFVGLVGLAVVVRLVSDRPNFNAVTAAALFAGFFFRSRMVALCVPLLAQSISDVWLGGYDKTMMVAVYAAMWVPIAWRGVLRQKLSPLTVGAGAVSSSLTFFVLSNAAVWYAWYPRTLEGLLRCYTAAVAFLGNSLASDVLFSAGFFGAYALAVWLSAQRVPAAQPEAA